MLILHTQNGKALSGDGCFSLELEAIHWHRLIGVELELVVLGGGRHGHVLLVIAKVRPDDVEGFLVDLGVLMRLQKFDFV